MGLVAVHPCAIHQSGFKFPNDKCVWMVMFHQWQKNHALYMCVPNPAFQPVGRDDQPGNDEVTESKS